MSEARTCNLGHRIESDNSVWRVDKRRAGGGHWACKVCFFQQKRESQERRRATRRLVNQKYAASQGRKGNTRATGPNKMVEDAAHQIALEAMSPEDVARLLDEHDVKIANARLRFARITGRGPKPDEVRLERERILEAVNRLAKDESKKPWGYLRVKPDAEDAWQRFSDALDKARDSGENLPNCEGKPEIFQDYAEDDMPTAFEARLACNDCPLLLLCEKYANADKPAYGIWAGKRWLYGEVVHD